MMDTNKSTNKTRNQLLNLMLLKAFRERWSDSKWGINIKTVLPRGVSGDVYNLADCIIQQAVVGSDANKLILSYLRHTLCSHLISHSSVFKRISKYNFFDKTFCVIALLEFLETVITGVTCRMKPEESALGNAMLSLALWLSDVYAAAVEVYRVNGDLSPDQKVMVERATNVIEKITNQQFLMGVIFVAKHQDADILAKISRNYIEIKKKSISAGFNVPGKQFEEYLKKIAYIDLGTLDVAPNAESSAVETITNCLQPLLAVKVHLNPSSDTQTFVNDLLMIQRLKNYSLSRLFCETIRACLMSLYNACGTLRESIWCAFAFIKLPHILRQLYVLSDAYDDKLDYCPDVVKALEQICEDPIVDFMDTKCACNTIEFLLVELGKKHLVNEKHIKLFTSKRDTISAALMKIDLNNQPPSPIKFVIRVDGPFTGILKALDSDYNKMKEPLVGMLCQVLNGNTFDFILSVATVEGKLKTFVSRLIKCNEMSKQVPGEVGKPAVIRGSLFDVSFLILTFIVQMYGSNVVLDERGNSFFEKWVRECMMERNKNKSPMNMVHLSDQCKVDELLAHLNSTEGGLENSSLKWQEICVNIPGMLYQLLMAWENDTISATEVKSNLDNMKQRLCCYAVCASSWLCSYMQVVRDDELLKPMNMVQQFLQPSAIPDDATQQENFNERLLLAHQIIKKMKHDVHPVPNQKIRANQNIVSQNPLEQQFTEVWKTIVDLGWLPIESTQILDNLLQSCGPFWLVTKLINEIMQCKYSREMYKTMDVVFALMHLDIEKCSIALLNEWLPMILLNKNQKPEMIEPQSTVLARLCVYTILATLDTASTTTSRKRSHPSDSEDMDSVAAPLLKSRKLNADVTAADASSTDFITETMMSARSESPAVREPLQSCLQNLFKIFAQFLKCDEVSPKINFIFEFLLLLVQCGREKIKPVLKLLPNGLVQNLLKIITTDEFTVGFILRMYDLNTVPGRQSAMTDLCLLRNIELRKESINL